MTWKKVKIGDVCSIVSGATPKTGTPSFWDGDIPWVTPKDLSASKSKLIGETVRHITEKGLKSCSAKMLPVNSVLFSSRAPIGLVAINTVPMCTNQGFKSMVPSSAVLSPGYLFWWLKSNQERIACLGRGATFKEVSKKIVEDLEIPLPPLAEQKRISGILDAADALRAKRRETIAQLDTLLQSVFLEMFGDPVTNLKNFPLVSLCDYYTSSDGVKCGPFGSALKKEEYTDSGIPVWCMDNISVDGREVMPFRLWISKEKFDQMRAYSVCSGDIVISRAGTVGKMCVVNDGIAKSVISTNLIRLRLCPKLNPVFFVALMTICKGRVGRLKTGPDGAFTHMSTKVLDKLKFPYPHIDLQNRFADIVASVERQKARLQAHLEELDTLFLALQQKAFNGEL